MVEMKTQILQVVIKGLLKDVHILFKCFHFPVFSPIRASLT